VAADRACPLRGRNSAPGTWRKPNWRRTRRVIASRIDAAWRRFRRLGEPPRTPCARGELVCGRLARWVTPTPARAPLPQCPQPRPEGRGRGSWPRNKLFGTLDRTTRRLDYPSARRPPPNATAPDTVGFKSGSSPQRCWKPPLPPWRKLLEADGLLNRGGSLRIPACPETLRRVHAILRRLASPGPPQVNRQSDRSLCPATNWNVYAETHAISRMFFLRFRHQPDWKLPNRLRRAACLRSAKD